jgi:hypothetical protein
MPSPVITPTASLKALNVHTRQSFVGKKVKEQANTKAILDAIYPYFPLDCTVISGYLTTADLYWKVSYHWDLLLTKLEQLARSIDTSEAGKIGAQSVIMNLWTVPPNPPRGYAKDENPGDTKDQSTHAQVMERHGVLKLAKKEARLLFISEGIIDPKHEKNPPKKLKPWWLAIAPVAPPQKGRHATGFALDIAGDNIQTTRIAKALGATLVFNEASHVHCEFAKPLNIPAFNF